MTSKKARRPISELPGDPAHLRFVYSHAHPAEPYEFEDTLEAWGVSVLAPPSDEEDEDYDPNSAPRVGRVSLYRLRDFAEDDRWDAADSWSGDLEVIAAAVLGGYGRRQGYAKAFENRITQPVGDLLILDRVHLDREWRGFGLGPIIAAEAIRRLSPGCCAVAAYPAMSEYPQNREEVTDTYRKRAKKKIAALWESIGFERFRNGVWLLDTALQEPIDLHRARRADLLALSHAYRGASREA
ncbi:hypothetical protein [Kitasatospora azatica]|uniref:hypothetical protein n=1 Tax=Kitasatospora azatica TaxID=58347 RepID=UPI000565634F|nr:hypothetical protein [Kitasatospora azatica]